MFWRRNPPPAPARLEAPQTPQSRLQEAQQALQAGDPFRVQTLLQDALDGPPSEIVHRARILLARALLALGKHPEARRHLEFILAEDIRSEEAWSLLSQVPSGAEETAQDLPGAGGRFVLKKFLARGGSGRVYLAQDALLPGPVAVKLFDATTHPASAWQTGTRLVASLPPHPHLLPILDAEPELGLVVLPYLPRGALQIPEGGTPPPLWRQHLLDVVSALGHLHHHGVVHLDLKPANLLRSDADRLLLSDFSTCRTAPARGSGFSIDYAAPEALLDEPLGPAADLYSLGILAYQLATGQRPFPTSTPIRTQSYRPLAQLAPHLPPSASDLVDQLLRLEPAQRPSLSEVRQSLQQIQLAV